MCRGCAGVGRTKVAVGHVHSLYVSRGRRGGRVGKGKGGTGIQVSRHHFTSKRMASLLKIATKKIHREQEKLMQKVTPPCLPSLSHPIYHMHVCSGRLLVCDRSFSWPPSCMWWSLFLHISLAGVFDPSSSLRLFCSLVWRQAG